MRGARFILFLLVLGLAAPAGAATPQSTDVGTESVAGKIDARLSRSILLNESVTAIVTGTPHAGIEEAATRAQTTARLEAAAAPFFTAMRDASRTLGLTVTNTLAAAPAVVVKGPARLIEKLTERRDVEFAEKDDQSSVHLIEPLPSYDVQNSTGRKQLQAEDIWALGFRGEGIKVSVIDTGINPAHEAFKNADGSTRITLFKDWISNNPTPYDDHGHGTHVAGTVLGDNVFVDPTFGAFQEVGVAPKATLMVSKFLSSSGSGSFENGINSLQWSYTNGADISSNSWGSSCGASMSTLATVRQLTDLGMLSVFAAGNSGPGAGSVGGPACSESALSVGAIDVNKNIASFSSRGPCSDPEVGSPSRICPDVVAKGVAVRSAIPRSGATNSDPSGYKVWQGTSMATPHIAGAAALIEQMKRFFTGTGWDTAARAEEQVFKLTALDLGAAAEDNTFGWGLPQLLNIYALLNASDDANIVSTFGVSSEVVRLGDFTDLSCSVRNLGGAIATGPFVAKLIAPGGAETTLKSVIATLGLLDGESVTHRVSVNGNLAPGDYTFTCNYNYTWTDGNGDPQSGSVAHSKVFSVKRVFVEMTLAGLAANTLPVLPQAVSFTAKNTGNEDASSVVIEVTVPDDYLFLPGENFDPLNLDSRYSNPAPSSVISDSNFGRVTLIFNVGTLVQGASFNFTATLIPTLPGTYRSLSVAKFKDGAGKGFSQGSVTTQEVGIPA